MNRIAMLVILLLTIGGGGNLLAGTYSGGTGTVGDPYKIASSADLIELSNTSGDWSGKFFIQTQNIYFDEDETQVDWDGDNVLEHPGDDASGFKPIGSSASKFQNGQYDGQNHTISNLYVNRSTTLYIGMFGYFSSSIIKNIGMIYVDIKGSYYTGGLFGRSDSSTISNCYSTGVVNSDDNNIGGLGGSNTTNSIIENCFSSVDVTGSINVGCLVGISSSSEIRYCYSTGSASSNNGNSIGGLVGWCSGSINNSYSTAIVTRTAGTSSSVGGFIGKTSTSTNITNCYSTGSVSFTGSVPEIQTDKGFVGEIDNSDFSNCFWDTETSGAATTGGYTGVTGQATVNMKSEDTFTNWDFTGDSETDWAMSSSITFDGYPTLRWTGGYSVAPLGGNIASVMNLVWIAENNTGWGGGYTQTADIDMWSTPSWDNGKGWTPIGNSGTIFTGNYNGDNNRISNLYINRPVTDYIGLFGFTFSATIANLGLLNVNINGSNYVGCLVGWNENTLITSSYSIGNVIGETYVGGLLGVNTCDSEGSSVVNKSFTNSVVTGSSIVGGFIGFNTESGSEINNSYSLSNVYRISGSDDHNIGGFIGRHRFGTITNSYSVGSVSYLGLNPEIQNDKGFIGILIIGSTTTNCFWDKENSGSLTSTGTAIGKLTGESTTNMKTQSTFTNWDFTPESGDWDIQSGLYASYPYLQAITYDTPGATLPVNPIPGLADGNAIPTSENAEVTTNEDTDKSFESANFPFTDTDNGDVLTSIQVVILPTKGTLYLDVNSNGEVDTGDTVIQNQEILTADIPKLKFKPIANEFGILTEGKYSYTTFKFKVSDGADYSLADYRMTINVNPLNDPPVITDDKNPTITPQATIRIGGKIGATVGTWNDDKDNPAPAK